MEINLCNNESQGNEVSFCCVQVVPGNLEIDENELIADNIELTFTPKLSCCKNRENIMCNIGGMMCEISAEVIKLVGCIEYALSTEDGHDPISGIDGAEAVAACCSSIVCVDSVICCAESSIGCPEDLEAALRENPITYVLNDAEVEECPDNANLRGRSESNNICSDKKLIKFTGKFILPDICVPVPPPVECPEEETLTTPNNDSFRIEFVSFNGTWCYDVTVLGTRDLSHWVLELCDGITEEDISNVTSDGDPVDFEIGTDPVTGVDGIKFDNLAQSVADGTVRYCFDLDNGFGLTTVDVGVKSGGPGGPSQQIAVGEICGPECV